MNSASKLMRSRKNKKELRVSIFLQLAGPTKSTTGLKSIGSGNEEIMICPL